jgi:hypothetical protein
MDLDGALSTDDVLLGLGSSRVCCVDWEFDLPRNTSKHW